MQTQTQTLIDISSLVNTDITLESRFDSALITLEDLEAFFHLLRIIMEAAESEINRGTGGEVFLIPEVTVSGGSAKAKIKVKASGFWSDATKQAAATILGAIIGLTPLAVNPHESKPELLSEHCVELVTNTVREADANWRKLHKPYSATLEIKCGNIQVKSSIQSPGAEE